MIEEIDDASAVNRVAGQTIWMPGKAVAIFFWKPSSRAMVEAAPGCTMTMAIFPLPFKILPIRAAAI